jgi:hypothetical protein
VFFAQIAIFQQVEYRNFVVKIVMRRSDLSIGRIGKYLFLFFGIFIAQVLSAQIALYYESFGQAAQAPALPQRWSANSAQVMTDPNTPSSGYPGASGGNNLMTRNCQPEWEERIFEVAGISTMGYTGISIGFGHRRTSCFVPPVYLEWSPDGFQWELLEEYLVPVQIGVWSWAGTFYLPGTADNREEIFFRWWYWTESGSGCSFHCNTFAGNYRIDDVIIQASVPLPVEWLAFDARSGGRDVLLHWATASETGNAWFEVQRSTDGRDFHWIGTVPGGGNSAVRRDYHFSDAQPFAGTAYYRIRQVDEDGGASFSPLRAIRFTGGIPEDWSLQPYSGGFRMIRHSSGMRDGPVLLEVISPAGRQLFTSSIPSGETEFMYFPNHWPPGVYFLRLQTAGRQQILKYVHGY